MPAIDAHNAVADVDGCNHARGADRVDDGVHRLRRVGGDGTDDHLLGAASQPGLGVAESADASADLHVEVALGQTADDGRLDWHPGTRGVEVDYVQPRAWRHVEPVENLFRIAVGRDVREVAALQANDVAAQEVE